MSVREEFISRSELETIQMDFETSITQNSTEIRMDFTAITDEIKENVSTNQLLLEEYIPVSYTHLDVYKRQPVLWRNIWRSLRKTAVRDCIWMTGRWWGICSLPLTAVLEKHRNCKGG